MKTLLIIGFVIVTLFYIGSHHLFNWAFRKTADDDSVNVPIAVGYIIINGLYWVFAVNVFKVIL